MAHTVITAGLANLITVQPVQDTGKKKNKG